MKNKTKTLGLKFPGVFFCARLFSGCFFKVGKIYGRERFNLFFQPNFLSIFSTQNKIRPLEKFVFLYAGFIFLAQRTPENLNNVISNYVVMLEHRYPTRVVNVRYTVDGLRFDAAIDCDWQLHYYGESPDEKNIRVPIELYCFDHQDWDIRMLYQDLPNNQPKRPGEYYILHTEVEWEGIIKETRKWIEEMTRQISEPEKPEKK